MDLPGGTKWGGECWEQTVEAGHKGGGHSMDLPGGFGCPPPPPPPPRPLHHHHPNPGGGRGVKGSYKGRRQGGGVAEGSRWVGHKGSRVVGWRQRQGKVSRWDNKGWREGASKGVGGRRRRWRQGGSAS